jgi:hypothetical protein
MSARRRVQKYPSGGGAADLARVEVLVPPAARDDLVACASRLRAEHRDAKQRQQQDLQHQDIQRLGDTALASYRTRINIDLDRLPDLRSRAAVIAPAMIDRGDARAFALGRKLLASIEGASTDSEENECAA